jgi:hypothetical protein
MSPNGPSLCSVITTLSTWTVATVMPLFSKSCVSSTCATLGTSTHPPVGNHRPRHGFEAFSP